MKILLVDDDAFFQNFYSNKLIEAGYELAVAGNGDEALAKFDEFSPELLLLDLIMPQKDGFEVLIALQTKNVKKVPIIVFSTLGNQQDIDKAMQLGATDYINKSFYDFENLKAKIVKYSTTPV